MNINQTRIIRLIRDAILITVGSAIFAVGLDCFEIPNGLAAGGVTGLATVFWAIAKDHGILLPVGMQVLAMNVLLMIPVIKSGGLRYAARTVAGIVLSSVFTDLFAPFLPVLGQNDLLLCSLWGGILVGFGLGLVFRTGGNTGGTDILAQLCAKHSVLSVGTWAMIFDALIIVVSIPVFSLENALYAVVAMVITCVTLDFVVDGPKTERMAWIISEKYEDIAHAVMYELGRGCTEVQARGVWSGDAHPMLLVVLNSSEIGPLKTLVADIDPESVVIVSEAHEVFGEGFKGLQG